MDSSSFSINNNDKITVYTANPPYYEGGDESAESLASLLAQNTSQINNISKPVNTLSDFLSNLTSGINLILMTGTYTLTSSITSISNSVIIGGQNNAIIDGGGFSISVSNLQNVTFRNITFQNFNQFNLTNPSNILFENCTFQNFTTYGIVLNNLNNVKFRRCIINNIGNSSVNTSTQGSGIYANTGDSLSVVETEISRTYGQGGIFTLGVTNLRYLRNKIHDTCYRGLHFYTGTSTGLISDNDIWNCGNINTTNSGVGCNGIYSAGSTYGVSIINNRISNVYENGIEGLFGIIDDNIITGTGIDPTNHPTPSIEGIYPNPTADSTTVSIRKNRIKNTAGDGIKYYSSSAISNFNIIDNIIVDDNTNTNNGINISSDSSYSNMVIVGNTVRNKNGVIYLQNKPCTNVTVNNNKSVNSGRIVPNCNQLISTDGSVISTIPNKDFTSWTNSTTLANWNTGNATLSQVTDNNTYIPKISVTSSGSVGSIGQDFSLPKGSKNYILKVRYEGNTNIIVKFTPYLIDGVTLDNSNIISITSTTFSTSTFNDVYLNISTGAVKAHISIQTSSTTANDYVIVQSIVEKVVY